MASTRLAKTRAPRVIGARDCPIAVDGVVQSIATIGPIILETAFRSVAAALSGTARPPSGRVRLAWIKE